MPQERQQLTIYTAQDTFEKATMTDENAMSMTKITRRKLTPGERLLRNSAIACAMLFGILSLQNIDHPWAQAASNAVEKALTVDFDVDDTLGELHFVKRFLPESALVFWNISDTDRLKQPVNGTILHEYSDMQPWYTFVADNGEILLVGKAGSLAEAVQTSQGDWMLLIEHPDGSSTLYGYVDRGTIEIGEAVSTGEAISTAANQGCVYLEYRRDGIPVQVAEFLP